MIVNFKIFEETETLNKYPFDWYKGKWYIHYSMNYKYDWEQEIGFLALISEFGPPQSSITNSICMIHGESITLKKNGEIKPGSGLAYTYKKNEFDELDFLTTEELLEKHYNIFIALFNKCSEDIKSGKFSDYYMKQVKMFFNLLEPVLKKHPDAYNDYLIRLDSKKYNL